MTMNAAPGGAVVGLGVGLVVVVSGSELPPGLLSGVVVGNGGSVDGGFVVRVPGCVVDVVACPVVVVVPPVPQMSVMAVAEAALPAWVAVPFMSSSVRSML